MAASDPMPHRAVARALRRGPAGGQVFSAEALADICQHMSNGLAFCRMLFRDGRPVDFVYLYTNPAFHTQTHLGDVVGKLGSEVFPGLCETDPALLALYGRVASGGPPERVETLVKAVGHWASVRVYCPMPEHFVGVFDVITDRKVMEKELQGERERTARELADRRRRCDLPLLAAAEGLGALRQSVLDDEQRARLEQVWAALQQLQQVILGPDTRATDG